jgi:putative transposase
VKKKRFSIEQITAVLQQAEGGVPVGDVCRQVGISSRPTTGGRRSTVGCPRVKPAS